jgi:ribosomal protein S18 acetylase RimI-like enzyme
MTEAGNAAQTRAVAMADPPAPEDLRVEFAAFVDGDVRRFIDDGLNFHSIAVTGLPNFLPVNFLLRGACGDVLGGLLGQIWGGWLHVTHLWVAEAARGSGHGTRLMRSAEAYARARGAVGATLDTFSFQARPFYERLGYEVFGILEGYPPGAAKYFLRKSLA